MATFTTTDGELYYDDAPFWDEPDRFDAEVHAFIESLEDPGKKKA